MLIVGEEKTRKKRVPGRWREGRSRGRSAREIPKRGLRFWRANGACILPESLKRHSSLFNKNE